MQPFIRKPLLLVFLLLCSCFLTVLLFLHQFYFSTVVMGGILVLIICYLYRTLNRNAAEFQHFINAIRFSDFNLSYRPGSFHYRSIPPHLANALEEALTHYKQNLQQTEARLQFFEALADHIDTAVLVYHPEGKIEWMNKTFRQLVFPLIPQHIDDLSAFSAEFGSCLHSLRTRELSLLHVRKADQIHQFALSGMRFTQFGRSLTAVSLKNIRTVLENQEIESWKKLIRVLTHEMMNSLTPILSLSAFLSQESDRNTCQQEDFRQALKTIHRRSEGLLHFIENYRKMSQLPSPRLEAIEVREFFETLRPLLPAYCTYSILPDNLSLILDKTLIEQVILNLVKNAREACLQVSHPHIGITARRSPDNISYLEISDNGQGILPEVLPQIFVPFFTTKPEGSGIGLSISRQIMLLHHGYMTVSSIPQQGTVFRLYFPPF